MSLELITNKISALNMSPASQDQELEKGLVDTYQSVFTIATGEQAGRVIRVLKEKGLTDYQIERLPHNVSFLGDDFDNAPADQLFRTKTAAGSKLPRSILFDSKGVPYILFNKVKSKGDRCLGRGFSKTVKIAMNLQTGEMCAVASIKTEGKPSFVIKKEFSLMQKIQKNNECVFYAFYNDPAKNKAHVIIKLYDGDLMGVYRNGLTPQTANRISKRLLQNSKMMHDQGIVHRDIKEDNIFVKRDPNTKEITDAVLGDFGFACEMTPEDLEARKQCAGTIEYVSPEFARFGYLDSNLNELAKIITPAHDRWALGLVLVPLHFDNDIIGWNWRTNAIVLAVEKRDGNALRREVSKIANLKEGWFDQCVQSCNLQNSNNPYLPIMRRFLSVDPQKRTITDEEIEQLPEE